MTNDSVEMVRTVVGGNVFIMPLPTQRPHRCKLILSHIMHTSLNDEIFPRRRTTTSSSLRNPQTVTEIIVPESSASELRNLNEFTSLIALSYV